jgi:hypothetical protein
MYAPAYRYCKQNRRLNSEATHNKLAIVSQQITEGVFYKRVGFWCCHCDFLPVCLGNTRKAKETLVRIGYYPSHK